MRVTSTPIRGWRLAAGANLLVVGRLDEAMEGYFLSEELSRPADLGVAEVFE